MTVYVDDARGRLGRMRMAHLTADTLDELVAFARRIGLKPDWLQAPPDHAHTHFDLCQAFRVRALEAGAVPVSQRELARRARSLSEAAASEALS